MSDTGKEYKHFLLLCSCISAVSCILVLLAIASDPLGAKSVNTKLIFRLLFCDLAICLIYGVYYGVDNSLSADDTYTMNVFCEAYLPFPLYFFLASWGWTALLAYRFSIKPKVGRHERKRTKKLPVPMYWVWVASFLLILPTVVSSIFVNGSVSNIENSARSRECIYNYSSRVGQVLNVLTLLVPMCITLLYNIYCYRLGLVALQTAPQSVIGRQMRRAGGYVLVLIGVWGPNFAFSLLRVLGGANDNGDFHSLLNAGLALSTLQGFFNVGVYVYTNKHTRAWISQTLLPPVPAWPLQGGPSGGPNDCDSLSHSEALASAQFGGNSSTMEDGTGNSILKQPTAKILLNQRALLAAKAEEAEYNRYMREKERTRLVALQEAEEVRRLAAQASDPDAYADADMEGGGGMSPVRDLPLGGSSSGGSAPTEALPLNLSLLSGAHMAGSSGDGPTPESSYGSRQHSSSSDYSGHEAKYLEYRQSASPLARFVAPLWSQYDSDEEEEIARLTELEGQADNTAANRSIGGFSLAQRGSSIVSTINPMAIGHSGGGPNTVGYEMSESRSSRTTSVGRVVSGDTSTSTDDRARVQSYATDSTEGRDSDKYVRFGNNDTRLISTNSETRDRMAQLSEDSDPQTLSNTLRNSAMNVHATNANANNNNSNKSRRKK